MIHITVLKIAIFDIVDCYCLLCCRLFELALDFSNLVEFCGYDINAWSSDSVIWDFGETFDHTTILSNCTLLQYGREL